MPHLELPLFDDVPPVPHQGRSDVSRTASFSGALVARATRKGKTATYLQILRNHGPISDQDVAALTKWSLSSVNSIRGSLADGMVIARGVDVQTWDDGKQTKRTQWGLR